MKKIFYIIFVCCVLVIPLNAQKSILEINIPKIERRSIYKMRKLFKIPFRIELKSTIVFTPIDTVRFYHYEQPFELNRTLSEYLQKLKINTSAYEVFIYDRQLTNIYVDNRVFMCCNKREKVNYIGNFEDLSISSMLLEKNYDYVFNIFGNDLGFYTVMLGFKRGLVELAYYRDGEWHYVLMCGSDDFSFLKPLLDDQKTDKFRP